MRKLFKPIIIVLLFSISIQAQTCLDSTLYFNGTTDYIRVSDTGYVDFGDSMTIEARIRIPTINTSSSVIYNIATKQKCVFTNDFGYTFVVGAGKLTFRWSYSGVCGSGVYSVTDPNYFLEDTCLHVAATHSLTETKLYVDGNLVATASHPSNTSPIFNSSRDLLIGVFELYNGTLNGFFDGEISEFRLWDIVRSQSEIQQAMNHTLSGNESGLALYFPLHGGNSGNNAIVYNESIYGSINDGTMKGTASTPYFGIGCCTDSCQTDSCQTDTCCIDSFYRQSNSKILSQYYRMNELSVVVAPNPFFNQVKLAISNYDFKNGTVHLSIFNNLGQLVYQQNNITKEVIDINTEALRTGVYYYQLRNENEILNIGILNKLE